MHLRDLTRFLAELSENNNRAWFVMNQPRYEILRGEFLQLVTELIAGISKFDPAVAGCNPKKALFRINRDMRFSHDKSPYKTTFSAAITASGLKKPSQGGGPAYYFHVDADGILLVAVGEYMPPADRLLAIRKRVVEDAAGFARLLKNKKLNDSFGGLRDDGKLARPPKGFAPDSPHVEYLKHKSYITWKETSLKTRIPDDLKKALLADFKNGYPLVEWLRQAK